MSPFFSPLQVLRTVDQQDPPLSLALLRLPPEDRERQFILRALWELARQLDHSPEYLRSLVRHESWNYALVGGALSLSLQAKSLTPDLVWRIEHGTWAAPQLAAFCVLLGHPDVEGLLSLSLATASIESSAKTVLSCYAALDHLGSRLARDFSERPLFRTLTANDLDDSVSLTRRTVKDWSEALRKTTWKR